MNYAINERWDDLMAKGKSRAEELSSMIVITSELAALVGKSPQWVRELTRDGVLKQVTRGKYNLGESLKDYLDHITGNKENNTGPRLVEHKTEHLRIRAEIAALELEEKKKNLHTTADVQHAWGALLVAFRERLLSLPPKLGTTLAHMNDPKEIRLLIEERFSEALVELSKFDPLASDDG